MGYCSALLATLEFGEKVCGDSWAKQLVAIIET